MLNKKHQFFSEIVAYSVCFPCYAKTQKRVLLNSPNIIVLTCSITNKVREETPQPHFHLVYKVKAKRVLKMYLITKNVWKKKYMDHLQGVVEG